VASKGKFLLVSHPAREIAPPLQSQARPSQGSEQLNHAASRPGHPLELIDGDDDRHRVAMARDRLWTVRLRKFDDFAELVLCVLERPRVHGGTITAGF
jgi:hypothetical protein